MQSPHYIVTADAISKHFSDDPERHRLADAFDSIERLPQERQRKDGARDELKKRENELFDGIYQAVVREELQVLLMDRDRFVQLPGLYLLTAEMADALKSSWAGKLPLKGPDTIWKAARLVFTETKWQHWSDNHAQQEKEAAAAAGTMQRTDESPDSASIEQSDAAAQPNSRPELDRARGVIEAIKAKGKQLKRANFNVMVRDLIGPRANTDELWRELTPEEWRKPGQGSPFEGKRCAEPLSVVIPGDQPPWRHAQLSSASCHPMPRHLRLPEQLPLRHLGSSPPTRSKMALRSREPLCHIQ